MSLFALHRRNRAALLGHLAAYEMTSSIPNRAYRHAERITVVVLTAGRPQ